MSQPRLKPLWVHEKQAIKVIELDHNQVPQSEDAEQAVLGCILIAPDLLLTVSAILTPEDFYWRRHAYIYRAMILLLEEGKAIDIQTLPEKLKTHGQLEEVGNHIYINRLVDAYPSHFHVMSYASTVKEYALRRRALVAADDIRRAALETNQPIDTCIELMEKSMTTIRTDKFNDTSQTLDRIVKEYLDNVEAIAEGKRRPGIPTGYRDIDHDLGGAYPGDLTIIGGLSGMGKTTFALNMAMNAIDILGADTCRVGFFTMEMTKEQLLQRLIASRAELSVVKLREFNLSPEEHQRFYEAAGFFYKMPLVINDKASLTPATLRTEIRRMMYEQHVRVVFVDGLWLMSHDQRYNNKAEETNAIARDIKEIAREFAIPIYITHQVNKGILQRQDKHPMKEDLEYGGHKDADRVYLIHRADQLGETEFPNLAEIIIGKNRHGRTGGTYNLYFDGKSMKFMNGQMKVVRPNEPEDTDDVPF